MCYDKFICCGHSLRRDHAAIVHKNEAVNSLCNMTASSIPHTQTMIATDTAPETSCDPCNSRAHEVRPCGCATMHCSCSHLVEHRARQLDVPYGPFAVAGACPGVPLGGRGAGTHHPQGALAPQAALGHMLHLSPAWPKEHSHESAHSLAVPINFVTLHVPFHMYMCQSACDRSYVHVPLQMCICMC